MSISHDPDTPIEAQGAALASWVLLANTIRLLKERGLLTQSDVSALFGGVLLSLERGPSVSDPVVHAARALLSATAADLGVPLKQPN
jgi:hypothetical protein